MLRVNFNSPNKISYNKINSYKPANNQSQPIKPGNVVPFKGGIDFVLVNKCAQKLPVNKEFKHIEDVLKTIGVKELELGDNIELARLLKEAMCRIKRSGFEVPSRIKCNSKDFENNSTIIKNIKDFDSKYKGTYQVTVPGFVSWDYVSDPILHFNPLHDWKGSNGVGSNVKDLRYVIWHEAGHYLHMMNHKNNPYAYQILHGVNLDDYQKEIVKKSIGLYASEGSVVETIAETFSRLVSGESYDKIHPEVYYIYSKYNGPMPNIKK